MGRANTIQTNFTSGEISPKLYGRVDVNKYFNGARKLRNMLVFPQGGAVRRPGTLYLGEVKDSTKQTLLHEFIYSSGDSSILEFSHLKLRIWTNDALVGAPLEVTTPYASTELADLQFTQSADVVYIAHPNYHPRTLSRVSPTNWVLAIYPNEDGPYLSTTPTDVYMSISNYSNTATATAINSGTICTTSGVPGAISGAVAVSSTDRQIKLTVVGHGFVAGDGVLITGVTSVPEANGCWVVSTPSGSTFILSGSHIGDGSTWAAGGSQYAIAIDYTHVEYRENNLWRLGQIMSISDPTNIGSRSTVTITPVPVVDIDSRETLTGAISSAPLYAITCGTSVFDRTNKYAAIKTNAGTLSWVFVMTFTSTMSVNGPKCKTYNFNDTTKEAIITGKTITATLTSSSSYFTSAMVGLLMRLKYGNAWVMATITGYTSATQVTVTLSGQVPVDDSEKFRLFNDGKTSTWKISAWSSISGYPSVVGFHQQRIMFGATSAEPTTLWLSESADYYSFATSTLDTAAVLDSSGITITLVSEQVNKIKWIESGPVLLVGTEGTEWQVKPSSIQQVLTPTNLSATIQTNHGSAKGRAIRIGPQTLFLQKSARRLEELSYDFSIDAFTSKDLSIISEHILRENGGCVMMALQKNPYRWLWMVLGNGKVACVTYEKEHDVVAWTLHDFGGGGLAESVAVIPAADGLGDYVYFVVNRTVNGSTKRYVERLSRLGESSTLTAHNFLDCCKLTTYGSPTDINTYAMAHLSAATVSAVVDGTYIGNKTVSSNNITVGFRGTVIGAGFLFDSTLGILDPEGGSPAGSSQAKKKRVIESAARVENSYYFKLASASVTTDAYELAQLVNDPVSADRKSLVPDIILATATPGGSFPYPAPVSAPPALFSGDVPLPVEGAYDEGGRFEIVQDLPYNLQVDALLHKLNTNE